MDTKCVCCLAGEEGAISAARTPCVKKQNKTKKFIILYFFFFFLVCQRVQQLPWVVLWCKCVIVSL